MKKNLFFLLVCFLIIGCNDDKMYEMEENTNVNEESETRSVSDRRSYTIRVFIHIIRETNGNATPGFDKETVSSTIMSNLNQDYENTNLSFCLSGVEYIDNSDLNNFSTSKTNTLFNQNSHSNAIDIYVLSYGGISTPEGEAQSIPSKALFVKYNHYKTNLVSHLMGHCLGLRDTSTTNNIMSNVSREANFTTTQINTMLDTIEKNYTIQEVTTSFNSGGGTQPPANLPDVRVSCVFMNTPHPACKSYTLFMSSPNGTVISNGYPYWDDNSIIKPLFVTEDDKFYVNVRIEHPGCSTGRHTIRISNGYTYSKTLISDWRGGSFHYSDYIPLARLYPTELIYFEITRQDP